MEKRLCTDAFLQNPGGGKRPLGTVTEADNAPVAFFIQGENRAVPVARMDDVQSLMDPGEWSGLRLLLLGSSGGMYTQ